MITIALASVLAVVVLGFILSVRAKDLPEPEPVSPFAHLDDRKAAIYDGLRDAQFEFRVGKLSDEDYQHTKKQLQKELAGVMAEVDRIKGTLPAAPSATAAPASPKKLACPSCGAQFERSLKFCGECGKPMKVRA